MIRKGEEAAQKRQERIQILIILIENITFIGKKYALAITEPVNEQAYYNFALDYIIK